MVGLQNLTQTLQLTIKRICRKTLSVAIAGIAFETAKSNRCLIDQCAEPHSEENHKVRKIIEWISPSDLSSVPPRVREETVKGTCQWFLDSKQFRSWRKKETRHLWVSGKRKCVRVRPEYKLTTADSWSRKVLSFVSRTRPLDFQPCLFHYLYRTDLLIYTAPSSLRISTILGRLVKLPHYTSRTNNNLP